MLYTKLLHEFKIDYEEYIKEREVDFFGMKAKYLKYIQTKGVESVTFKPMKVTTNTGHTYIIRYTFNAHWKHKFIPLIARCYRKPEGIYVVTCPSTIIKVGKCTAYIPHYFDRYRERILKRKHGNKLDVILTYFENNVQHGVGTMIENEVYPNSLLLIDKNYISFGSLLNDMDVYEMRTLISVDMLKEMQKYTCSQLITHMKDFITEELGEDSTDMLLHFLTELPNYKV